MSKKKYKIGYTQGVFDMFHIGHLNLLNNAKKECEILIVGVNSDLLTLHYKGKSPIICEQERAEIVRNIKAVDRCIIVDMLDKVELYNELKFDAIFIGDDWKNTARWKKTEKELGALGVKVNYLPYTQGISTSIIKKRGIKNEDR